MNYKEIFGKVKIYKLHWRVDNRGSLEYVFDENTALFKARETRIYSMPKEGTFFGIHYREESDPMTKFVTVIKGRGQDYIIDLRKDSPTYLKWESMELSEENALAVLIPAGFGHAFISLQNDTIQLYSVDRSGSVAHSKQINYKDSKIGLKLPLPISEISDYDLNAPFVSESGEEFGEEGKRKKDIHIQPADMKYLDNCIDILQNSDLGKVYFSDHEKAMNMLTYAVGQENVYVALDENEKCLGFIYYMKNGVFGSYPYLHIVAVKEEYRNYGIGKQLMKFFEDNASDSSSAKYFLTVDDFNPGAKKLYENLGYECVGELPDFYKKGINCYLMMKRR